VKKFMGHKWMLPACGIAGLMFLPLIAAGSNYLLLILITIGIYIIATSGLDILFGYCGQMSLGHAAYYCIGAYVSALLSLRLHLPVFLCMLIGGIMAAVIGAIIAYPAVKLSKHFLSLVTIGFGEIMYLFVANAEQLTGGYSGINFIPRPAVGSFVFDTNFKYFYLVAVLVVAMLMLKQMFYHSKYGRAFIAIKENEEAAAGNGINVRMYKVFAFAISAFYTGIAGAVYAHLVKFISPDSFTINLSTMLLVMMLFGGAGQIAGPIIGSICIALVSEALQSAGNYQMLVYGLFLLVVVLFLPQGVLGTYDWHGILKRFGKGNRHGKTSAN
jgi:branched-chain amino acid transport system permease protein